MVLLMRAQIVRRNGVELRFSARDLKANESTRRNQPERHPKASEPTPAESESKPETAVFHANQTRLRNGNVHSGFGGLKNSPSWLDQSELSPCRSRALDSVRQPASSEFPTCHIPEQYTLPSIRTDPGSASSLPTTASPSKASVRPTVAGVPSQKCGHWKCLAWAAFRGSRAVLPLIPCHPYFAVC
jgi:hypothetical protein